jgi:LacI family repressor for deo operon, udp, cdd, tsx, nupC, and nupG
MGTLGEPLDEELVVTAEWSVGSYEEAAARLVPLLRLPARSRPTAILGSNDQFAIAAMHRIRETGLRVPEDISVVGIDDMPEARTMDLTTVRQDPRLIGGRAAEILLALIDKELTPGYKEFLPAELVVRGSVAAAGAEA